MCNFPKGAINPFNRVSTNNIVQGNLSTVARTSNYQNSGSSSNSNNVDLVHDIVMMEDSDESIETDDEDEDYPPLTDAELEKELNTLKKVGTSASTRGQPLPQGAGYAPVLIKFTLLIAQPPKEDCSICMESLHNQSGFGSNIIGVLSLVKCNHMFHAACLQQMVKDSPHHLQCPACKTFHGYKIGTQPSGEMRARLIHQSLPGHNDCNTIEITYNIKSGIQGPEHPNPGQRYTTPGFPRVAFLPNNTKGTKVLSLLKEAFIRRLIFTVGTSVTSGAQNVVTWNEVHHKTEFQTRSGHGYPDPNYLDNVLMELSLHGVTDNDTSSTNNYFQPFTVTS